MALTCAAAPPMLDLPHHNFYTLTLRPAHAQSVPAALSFILSLPAEIRNIIYRLLLTSPHIPLLRKLATANHASSYVLPPVPVYPALLATCRQIHAEATPILYAENTYTAHSTLLTSLPYLFNPARPIRAPGISARISRWHIHIRLDIDARFSAEDVGKAFSGAKSLEVWATESMYRSAGYGVLRLFEGVRGVGDAVVGGSVERLMAEWLERRMMCPEGTEGDEPYEQMAKGLEWGGLVYDTWTHGNR